MGLILFVDGARLGSALTSPECDMTLKDLAALADCFYIGGTKNGLLFGEAMVIVNPALQKDFRYMIKHNGGMIAKGRLGGVMFLAALEHDDYFAWAKHANEMADLIRAGMERAGIPFFQRTTTNQIFAVLTEEQNAALELDFAYERWAKLEDGRVAVRFVTSWATDGGGLPRSWPLRWRRWPDGARGAVSCTQAEKRLSGWLPDQSDAACSA